MPDVSLLIPSQWGVSVVDLADLNRYLAEGETLEEAVTNAAFDTGDEKDVPMLLTRIRRANAGGDYWAGRGKLADGD